MEAMKLTAEDFRRQAEFRYHLRCFLRSSEKSSLSAGLEPNQYQLLLAIKGLPVGRSPNIKALAERLQIKQQSLVELVDRSVKKEIIERFQAGADRRIVLVRLTDLGEALVHEIALRNRIEMVKATPAFLEFLKNL